MKSFTCRLLAVMMMLTLLFTLSVVGAGAISYDNDVDIKSESALVINMDTDQVVFEKAADERRYPASTTKIMTYIVAVENIDDLDNTRVTIKQSIIDQLLNTGSSMSFIQNHVGDKVKVIDLLYSMMVPSGNDAAMVLADYVGGGDIDKFVDMMNEKAKELGCEDTHFANPDGLHDPEHYTTARDLWKITNYALTLPRFSKITNTTEYTCEGDEYPLVTTNYMIDEARGGQYYYIYAKGIKTGTTDEAGRCLVTTASADGYSYMAILLKAPYEEGKQEEYYTFFDAADLFRWALVDLELQTVKTTDTPVCEQKIKLAWGRDSVSLVPKKNLSAIVPKTSTASNIAVETNTPDIVEAPLTTDQVIGTATVYYVEENGEKKEIATVDLVPSENIERSGILAVLDVIGTIFQSYWFLIVIGVILLIVLIYFIISRIHRRRVAKRRKVKRYRNF